MRICQTCGTEFRCIDDIWTCENGHVLEHQVETVEVELGGRRASTVIRTQQEHKNSSAYEDLYVFFNIWKYYKKKYNFSNKIMKIYCTNIAYRNKTIRLSADLVKPAIILTVIYLSLRVEKEKIGTYFLNDFLRDIEDLYDITTKIRKELSILPTTKGNSFKKPTNLSFFTRAMTHFDTNFRDNILIFYLIEEQFIIWIKTFLRIVEDFNEFMDFSDELVLPRRSVDLRTGLSSKELQIYEQMLNLLKNGREYSVVERKLCTEKENSVQFPILNSQGFVVNFDTKNKENSQKRFIECFLAGIYEIKAKNIWLKANIVNLFLKFILSHHKDTKTIFFYELDTATFIYRYISGDDSLDDGRKELIFLRLAKYVGASPEEFISNIKKSKF